MVREAFGVGSGRGLWNSGMLSHGRPATEGGGGSAVFVKLEVNVPMDVDRKLEV